MSTNSVWHSIQYALCRRIVGVLQQRGTYLPRSREDILGRRNSAVEYFPPSGVRLVQTGLQLRTDLAATEEAGIIRAGGRAQRTVLSRRGEGE